MTFDWILLFLWAFIAAGGGWFYWQGPLTPRHKLFVCEFLGGAIAAAMILGLALLAMFAL